MQIIFLFIIIDRIVHLGSNIFLQMRVAKTGNYLYFAKPKPKQRVTLANKTSRNGISSYADLSQELSLRVIVKQVIYFVM